MSKKKSKKKDKEIKIYRGLPAEVRTVLISYLNYYYNKNEINNRSIERKFLKIHCPNNLIDGIDNYELYFLDSNQRLFRCPATGKGIKTKSKHGQYNTWILHALGVMQTIVSFYKRGISYSWDNFRFAIDNGYASQNSELKNEYLYASMMADIPPIASLRRDINKYVREVKESEENERKVAIDCALILKEIICSDLKRKKTITMLIMILGN